MLHENYVGIVNNIYNETEPLGYKYKMILNAVEKMDAVFIENEDLYVRLYKLKYSNPTLQEVWNFGKITFGTYFTNVFLLYFKNIK